MITINSKTYFTAKELAQKVGTTKSYVCRLAREGRIRHEKTQLGYLIPEETGIRDWENRSKRQ